MLHSFVRFWLENFVYFAETQNRRGEGVGVRRRAAQRKRTALAVPSVAPFVGVEPALVEGVIVTLILLFVGVGHLVVAGALRAEAFGEGGGDKLRKVGVIGGGKDGFGVDSVDGVHFCLPLFHFCGFIIAQNLLFVKRFFEFFRLKFLRNDYTWKPRPRKRFLYKNHR